MEPIGYVESPYPQKFAVPRQPGLVTAAVASIRLQGPYAHPDCVRELSTFSHIWVLFLFSETLASGWKPLVRPPRLGGNVRTGVFASRATYRPNGIGMSVVPLQGIRHTSSATYIDVLGSDWVDGTPVIDIKPYLPYAEAIPQAIAGYADSRPTSALTTVFTQEAQHQLGQFEAEYPQLALLIEQVLAQDPRPAYKKQEHQNKVYGMTLYDINIQWRVENEQNIVMSISKDF
ncbi:tRNA (N6-threonylcarbamoyladenosine(37)-N6)-methyltransferase TrmO [Pseudidiomarina aestuarii]|uniref:tRNA (N6-threonylcarbamoyladenosine(37)-N6)-methyltransferase TrmO n=1 Tax=Pseudidiomarina aestuarii TaxID=624146 RepID=A0A7Z7EV42_9GAMM|nr:tRNA (N6-threonylcarbamoyladenosine(37)-N6)-methyltransferase TrmO [Pseudidiomarina aestuarii]